MGLFGEHVRSAPRFTPSPRARGEGGVRGPLRESEPGGSGVGPFRTLRLAEAPPHRAESWFSAVPCLPLPARGARNAAARGEGCPAVQLRSLLRSPAILSTWDCLTSTVRNAGLFTPSPRVRGEGGVRGPLRESEPVEAEWGHSARSDSWKRPLTEPSPGFPLCRVSLSPRAGRGTLQQAGRGVARRQLRSLLRSPAILSTELRGSSPTSVVSSLLGVPGTTTRRFSLRP
jgi:hypothetical protein